MITDRRVAACVAACEGLNTEALASGALARLLKLIDNSLPMLEAAKQNGTANRLRAAVAKLRVKQPALAEGFSGYAYCAPESINFRPIDPLRDESGLWKEELADIPKGAELVGYRDIDDSTVAVFKLADGTYAAVMPHCLKWA